MNQEDTHDPEPQPPRSRKPLVLGATASLLVAMGCFIALAVLPAPQGHRFKTPLRSLLTGLGVFGIATPLCLAGFALKRRFASSPHFEGKFIATVLNVFGFACFAAGLACIIVGAYDWIMRLVESGS